ncbi:MAG: MXAN_5187 family protein [Polyangiales bacterium]
MMLLSRFWYAILSVALAAAVALLYISIHQHNRLREQDTRVIIDHDRDIVDWYLRIDARRRLDALAIVSIDDQVRNAIVKANGQDKVDSAVREPLKKRLGELATKFAGLIKDEKGPNGNPIALVAVDGRGRVVAHVNFDRSNQLKDESFELGGFPVVADALHGWLRDDTWVFDREAIYRVVARPVVAAEGAPPAGAVVAIRRLDDSFARNVVERTDTPVIFFVAAADDDTDSAKVAARGIPDKSDVSFDGVTIDEKMLKSDKAWGETGSTSLKQVGPLTMSFSRLVGMSWESGAGYAVARKVTSIADPSALLNGADDTDKKAVPVAIVAVIALLGIALGIGATVVEHTMPVNKLVRETGKFAKGDQDALPVAKLSGPFRTIGQAVNDGTERVIQKGGGASRKAADLEQILGPVPAAPQMSAFSFNFDGGAGGASASKPSAPGGADLFPNLPPAGPAVPPAKPAAPPPRATPQPAAAVPSAPISVPSAGDEEEEDDATMVSKIPDELMAAAKSGEVKAIESADELVMWKQTFEEFVSMRQKCGEPTTGLSFEKFQVQLRKNKEQLVKQYNCRRVKFTVYEKDGKAALKATPIKD